MAQEYAPRKAKQDTEAEPLLNDEDQNFLERITSEEAPPPLPERPVVILDNGKKAVGKDAQVALMAGADAIPLPSSPPVEGDTKQDNVDHSKGQTGEAEKKKRDYWSYVPNLRFTGKVMHANTLAKMLLTSAQGKAKEQMASDLQSVAAAVKSGSGDTTAEGDANTEAEKEQEDISSILDQLNLSAVNNRAFSFSKESQKLMAEFTQILKDIVNGVPTAYDDLEKLLTRSEGQLDKLFLAMPPFLQTLVKSLPAKMTSTLGPEFLAATSEKPGADAKYLNAESSKSTGKKKRSRIPSLKSLVGEKGAVAGMLRSILNFLKLRFPAVLTGTNVLMSLAVFRKYSTPWPLQRYANPGFQSFSSFSGTATNAVRKPVSPRRNWLVKAGNPTMPLTSTRAQRWKRIAPWTRQLRSTTTQPLKRSPARLWRLFLMC